MLLVGVGRHSLAVGRHALTIRGHSLAIRRHPLTIRGHSLAVGRHPSRAIWRHHVASPLELQIQPALEGELDEAWRLGVRPLVEATDVPTADPHKRDRRRAGDASERRTFQRGLGLFELVQVDDDGLREIRRRRVLAEQVQRPLARAAVVRDEDHQRRRSRLVQHVVFDGRAIVIAGGGLRQRQLDHVEHLLRLPDVGHQAWRVLHPRPVVAAVDVRERLLLILSFEREQRVQQEGRGERCLGVQDHGQPHAPDHQTAVDGVAGEAEHAIAPQLILRTFRRLAVEWRAADAADAAPILVVEVATVPLAVEHTTAEVLTQATPDEAQAGEEEHAATKHSQPFRSWQIRRAEDEQHQPELSGGQVAHGSWAATAIIDPPTHAVGTGEGRS